MTVSVEQAVSEAIDLWKSEGVELLPPLKHEQVRDQLARLAVPVADDILQLYTMTGGMQDGTVDSQIFYLWGFTRVIEQAHTETADGLEFADFMIDSYRYFLKPRNQSTSMIFISWHDGSLEHSSLGRTLTEFLHEYATGNSDERFRTLHD